MPISPQGYAVPLVLASSSPIRRAMLDAAGVDHVAIAPGVDEARLKSGKSDAADMALALAEAKAMSVSKARAQDWVIGSDSVVSVQERMFDKPTDRHEAAQHLQFFSGKPVKLVSAVALVRGGKVDWSIADRAMLSVRHLSDQFIQDYLDAEWPEVGYCVGVFRMEGRGIQLFNSVAGSHFTILGMPLIPLMGALRERGLLAA